MMVSGIAAFIYLGAMFFLNLAILIDFFKNFPKLKDYLSYGLIFYLIVLVFEFAILALSPFIREMFSLSRLVLTYSIGLIKILIITAVGIFSCLALNRKDIPLVRKFMAEKEYGEKLINSSYIYSTLGVALGAIGFSLLLFLIFPPQASQVVKKIPWGIWDKSYLSFPFFLPMALGSLEIAFVEEIYFRLGIQNYLAKKCNLKEEKYWIAVVITAGIWTLGHAYTLTPEWVKMVQIFPIGIALGLLFKKFGLESCILAHGIFNIGVIVFSQYWIKL